jgi:hypothetical protein
LPLDRPVALLMVMVTTLEEQDAPVMENWFQRS